MKCNCKGTSSFDRCSCYQKGYVDSSKEHKEYMDDCQKKIRIKNAKIRKLKTKLGNAECFIDQVGELREYLRRMKELEQE